jgi:methylated-DNA-[protein]-cysteine S-methyltransferase
VIAFATYRTPLGTMRAEASDAGITRLSFAAGDVGSEAPEDSGPAGGHLRVLQSELADYFAGILRRFTTPLDLKGTVFDRRVWQLLLAIPYGNTRSYGDLAAELGIPGGARAVGHANGRNPVAIVVPCHRVVASRGGLGGYGGGLDRKHRLLILEGATNLALTFGVQTLS